MNKLTIKSVKIASVFIAVLYILLGYTIYNKIVSCLFRYEFLKNDPSYRNRDLIVIIADLPKFCLSLIPWTLAIIVILKDLLVKDRTSITINWITIGVLVLLGVLMHYLLNYIFKWEPFYL